MRWNGSWSVSAEEASFDRVLATVLFTDIVGSTAKAAGLGDTAWKELLERHHQTVRALIGRYRGSEIDTAGDGFFAVFDGPARGVRCARSIVDAVRPLGLEVRAGLHTGEVETIDGKVGGMGAVIGARVGAMAGSSQVLVSSTVKELVAPAPVWSSRTPASTNSRVFPAAGTSTGPWASRPDRSANEGDGEFTPGLPLTPGSRRESCVP